MITLLEAETGTPVTADAMRYGIRVVAFAYPCSDQWRSTKGLELVGPRFFGYDVDYRPFYAPPGPARYVTGAAATSRNRGVDNDLIRSPTIST
jgi:hypothetical protein